MGAPQIGEDTKITVDLKTIGLIIGGAVGFATLYFTLQADIALAKELPAPVIDRVEYDLKDELIRQTIIDTQEDVQEIKETIEKIDERLYELQQEVGNMKYLNIILLLISFNVSAQEWISDDNFDNKINEKQAFGDDQNKPVIVEFYAKFNDANKFEQWLELKDVIYYRADIATCPAAKKKYKVRMAPTLIIFKDGIKETVFKAGLDLMLPVDLNEIQEAVDEVNTASQF